MALAVLARIAASDAACCAALGERSRGRDHRHASTLLRRVGRDGPATSWTLSRLLEIRDDAQYGVENLTGTKATAAMRQARALIDAAAAIVINR